MQHRLLALWVVFGCDAPVEPVDCGGSPPTGYFRDDDGDGYGRDDRVRPACEAPAGFVAQAGDCDDADAAAFPGAVERCGGGDDDCDGQDDEDPVDRGTWYADMDGDRFGDAAQALQACDVPAGYVADGTDCDDADATVNPGADERCGGGDEDCDGRVDADAVDAATWFDDRDGDGFGDDASAGVACDAPIGAIALGGDCDDTDPELHPLAEERCDEADRDCDGDAYAGAVDAPTWYRDGDGDGYGILRFTSTACEAPVGYAAVAGDCDDAAAAWHPGAPEFCDTLDHDCDGDPAEADSVDAPSWYVDGDGDGHGDAAVASTACEAPAGHVAGATDCDDARDDVYAGAPERCDGVDHDCDGSLDEADSVDAADWYADTDGDGYGDPDAWAGAACAEAGPAGAVADACDCDDTDAAYHPEGLDCLAVECPSGGEVWLDDSCGLREITAAATGSPYAPVELLLEEASTVWLCPGTHDLTVRSTGGGALALVGVDGAAVTTLRSGLGPQVQADGALSVEGLTLSLGVSTSATAAALDAGGDLLVVDTQIDGAQSGSASGVIVAAGGDLELDGVAITGNTVDHAAALSSTCVQDVVRVAGDLVLTDSELSGNTVRCASLAGTYTENQQLGATLRVAGDAVVRGAVIQDNLLHGYSGGMSSRLWGAAGAWVLGDLWLEDSTVARNVADAELDCAWPTCWRQGYGGGLRVGGDLQLLDSLVTANEVLYSGTTSTGVDSAALYGGGVYLDQGSMSCESSDGGDHGVYGNAASTAGGGVYWAAPAAGATLVSLGCDWTGSADNVGDDVAGGASWSGGDDAEWVCDAAGACVE